MNIADRQTHPTVKTAYIALGSNIGDREHYLQESIRRLEAFPGIEIAQSSSVYETEPVGYTDQGAFLNMVVGVETTLSPEQLFAIMQRIEQALGRQREIRFGPRTIDLDLLLFEELTQDRPELILPHPRMLERAFVLVPMLEVMKALQPERAIRYQRHLDVADGKEGVVLWKRVSR